MGQRVALPAADRADCVPGLRCEMNPWNPGETVKLPTRQLMHNLQLTRSLVAALMAKELDRTEEWARGQVAEYTALAMGYLPG